MEGTSPVLRFTNFLLVAHSTKFKMKYLNVNYRRRSCQDSQQLQNDTAVITQPLSLHYVFIFYNMKPYSLECMYLKQKDSLHTHAKFVVVAKFEFELGALWHEKRRGLAFYTGTSCLDTRKNRVNLLTEVHKRISLLLSRVTLVKESTLNSISVTLRASKLENMTALGTQPASIWVTMTHLVPCCQLCVQSRYFKYVPLQIL